MVVKTSVLLIYQCAYDGVEIGSTGMKVTWSYRDVSAVPRTNFIIANANIALAA